MASGGSIDPPFIEAWPSTTTTTVERSLADQLIRPSLKLDVHGHIVQFACVWRIN